MFLLYLSLFFLVFAALCAGRYVFLEKVKNESTGYDKNATFFIFITVFFILLSVFETLWEYSSQKEDYQNLKMYEQLEKVYAEKANILTTQFAGYLADTYPKHERDIYKSISPEKVSIYLAKYPDLQASKTITALVDQISQMQHDRYQQQVNRAIIAKGMRYRQVNPWIYNSWIPKYVE